MKKTSESTPANPVVPASVPPVQIPVLDLKNAKAVEPYRHEKTARTAAYHQAAGESGVHLFSATGNFIATVPAEEAAKFEPAPVPEPAPAEAVAASSSEASAKEDAPTEVATTSPSEASAKEGS